MLGVSLFVYFTSNGNHEAILMSTAVLAVSCAIIAIDIVLTICYFFIYTEIKVIGLLKKDIPQQPGLET
jgi:hypothetical protein